MSGIYLKDLTPNTSVLIENLRDEIKVIRGKLNDIIREKGYKDRLDCVEGLLTCGLISLYAVNQDIIKNEIARDDSNRGSSIYFAPRGIGLDECPGCFVCGTTKRNEEANMYLNNIAAFVKTKESGEQILSWFDKGARLDYREYEPNWIQLKIGACDKHLPSLNYLCNITSNNHKRIRKIDIIEAVTFHEPEKMNHK